jgi:hypothetical protein
VLRPAVAVTFASMLATAACNPKSLKPDYCNQPTDCASRMCNTDTHRCESTDASVDHPQVGDAVDGADGRDGSDVHEVAPPTCRAQPMQCADGGYDGSTGVCEPDAGVCVQCLSDNDCSQASKTPICEAHVCRPCQVDTECPDPAICMADGHCAIGEVMFVEFNSNGCPGATGSSASPFCLPNDAVTHVGTGKNVIVIRGPVADRLTLNTVGFSPVIIGKNSASIPATAATAIQVLSDTVLIRDLTVTGGTSATSKGIAVSGTTTALTLSSVQVSLGTGLGIQADTGAQLTMDHCTVSGNNKGGILVDAANFDIENTTVTGNGPGDDGGAAWGGLRLKNLLTTGKKSLEYLTVMGNNQVGVSCSDRVDAMNVLVTGSAGNVEVSQSCNFSSCGSLVTAMCGAQP